MFTRFISPLKRPTIAYRAFSTPATKTVVRYQVPEDQSLIHQKVFNQSSIPEMVELLTPLEEKCSMGILTGAMSFGSINGEAHEAIAEATNQIALLIHGVDSVAELKKLPGFKGPLSNSGEGGEINRRNNTLKQSLKRQVASGRFGMNGSYIAHASHLEIKINQGAKPGIGGELPGKKITEDIAEARLTISGITLASPPPHHDIYSIEDLKQLISNLRAANPNALIDVKLAASDGIGVIAAGVVKCGANSISIAGPGGTGAAPLSAKYEFVHPFETALAEVHQTLLKEGLRKHVVLIASGGIQTGLDYFKALLLGANHIEIGTLTLVSLGCMMAEVCHDGSCPAGIATTDKDLIKEKFKGTPLDVARTLLSLASSVANYLACYGFTDPEQAVGRVDLLKVKNNSPLENLEKLLYVPDDLFPSGDKFHRHPGSSYEEQTVIWDLRTGKNDFKLKASNQILSFGARIGYWIHTDEIFKTNYYQKPVTIRFHGLACGQSFGFLAPENLTLIVPSANDGTGASLDGATIYVQELNGNVLGYGATKGQLFVKETGGRAATRNSGAHIMVEKTGADCAGFMTGGSFTLLGNQSFYTNQPEEPEFLNQGIVGPNFASGFTGGKIFLPQSLYKKMLDENLLSSSAKKITPMELDEKELDELVLRLTGYQKEIHSPLVSFLLCQDKLSLKNHFIKLDPAFRLAPTSEHYPAETNKAVNLSIKDHFELTHPGETRPVPKEGLIKNKAEIDACGTGILFDRKGKSSRKLVTDSLQMLARFMHRGASGIDARTGDGCGITFYGLDSFFQKVFNDSSLEKRNYTIIHMGLPLKQEERDKAMSLFLTELGREDLQVAGSREVPVNEASLGYIGKKLTPLMQQFLVKKPTALSSDEFDTKLIRLHLRFEFIIHPQQNQFSQRPHIISAQSGSVIYKSMVKEDQLGSFFLDFDKDDFRSHTVVVHSRFSTNTLPSFMNIQLFRNLGNNGENNALQLLVNALSLNPVLKDLLDLETIDLNGFSDSHIMSIYLDLLRLKGFSPEEMVAFTMHAFDPAQKPSAEFYNLFGLPFEGPNASILTFGSKIVMVRDRNGFRPLRMLINEDLFYCGSELGPVEFDGKVYNLEPSKPLIIDLESREIYPYVVSEEKIAFHNKQIKNLQQCSARFDNESLVLIKDELKLRRLRAGWSQEVDTIIQSLYKSSKDLLVSMGDQRPLEALVQKPPFDFGSFFKGKFSQVTNPPLDSKREKIYTSTKTFVGRKPSLDEIEKKLAEGFVLASPLVNNEEMALLMASKILNPVVLDAIFPIKLREEGLQSALTALCHQAVEAVKKGSALLILSDLKTDDEQAAIPATLISALVHEALLKSGLRHQTSLGLLSGSTLTPRDLAQAISIGGADLVNPYLVFMPLPEEENDLEEFRSKCRRYQKGMTDELLAFMARVGLSTVSAYRGAKAFNAIGLDKTLALSLGIHCDFGGVGLEEIASMVINQHQQPKPEGLGRFNADSTQRTKIWDDTNTRAAIDRARGNKDNHIEKRMNFLKSGSPRGLLFLVPSQKWTHNNPMPICILGGGAAGFYQAEALLNLKLPFRIDILEKSLVNQFGLVGDGIAPDHIGTKNQARILRDLLDEKMINYYGGVEVGVDVSLDHLKKIYPCIIDCRGAAIPLKLNIPGENASRVVPASLVYKGYNNIYDPNHELQATWTFFQPSKNSEMGIIGMGNVAADIARIFLKSSHALKKTKINPEFLSQLENNGPDSIHIFARSAPHQVKISYSELLQLNDLKEVFLTASFDKTKTDSSLLSPEEKNLYQFFLDIKDKKPPKTFSKRIHFHFHATPKSFNQKRQEIDVSVEGYNAKTYTFNSVITCIGNKAEPIAGIDNKQLYASGWVKGNGGKLSEAEKSAIETSKLVRENFIKGLFHFTKSPLQDEAWKRAAPIHNLEQKQILNYLEDGFQLGSQNDFHYAKQYRRPIKTNQPQEKERRTELLALSSLNLPTPPEPKKNEVILFEPGTDNITSYPATGEETLLDVLRKDNSAPACQCGGELTCGECSVKIFDKIEGIEQSSKEKKLLEANDKNPEDHLLACAHKMSTLGNRIFFKPAKIEQKETTKAKECTM